MHVVVVESPAKAKTINKYLGKDYIVLASFGHVRDLPSKDGSVRPDEDFAMDYEVDADSKKHLAAIAKALKGADTLSLATDPDREGEAIAWHVLEALKASRQLPKGTEVQRVTFDEITKRAVTEAFTQARAIDMNLVNAQQARRALDYLVGFTLSPVLWRKLPGSKSAGRVQSVALRLVCERDHEIEQFESREYWDITVQMDSAGGEQLSARLVEWKGDKLEKFSITSEAQAKPIAEALRHKHFTVAGLEPKQAKRHPAPPFTTSTLQQEAARKLGFSAKKTMQLAQKLYEGVDVGGETAGLITYMRTDSVSVSQEAVAAARAHIGKAYGADYVPTAPRAYKSKAKNAQEAHEAIRPTDVARTPDIAARFLENDMARLYELVWKRMVASQMESALLDQLVVDIIASPHRGEGGRGAVSHSADIVTSQASPHPAPPPVGEGRTALRTTGSVVKFDGFLKLYQEGRDDEGEEDEGKRLPVLQLNEVLAPREVKPEQHFTEPPPRYSEASLVKKLEELGIGRPSTYASILSVLQDRGYVKLEKKRFIAESLGRIVNAFLVSFFEKYVEYGFTADLEDQLDNVSNGERDWKAVLKEFWGEFIRKINDSKEIPNAKVLEAVSAELEPYVFGKPQKDSVYRQCPACKTGQLGVKLGRYGAYIGCSGYPDCTHRAQIGSMQAEASDGGEGIALPKALGMHPGGEEVSLRKGPYGLYVQLGSGKTPKRASLGKGVAADAVTLEMALGLLALPRDVGLHPETGKMIVAGLGRFGPYLQVDGKFTSLPAGDDPLTVGINRAVDILAAPKQGRGGSIEKLKVLGDHPGGGEVAVLKGRYGPYVKHGKINATLPKGTDPLSMTLEAALALIEQKAASPSKGKSFKAKKRKA